MLRAVWAVGSWEDWCEGGVRIGAETLSSAVCSRCLPGSGRVPVGRAIQELPTCLLGLVLPLHPPSWGRLLWAIGGLICCFRLGPKVLGGSFLKAGV